MYGYYREYSPEPKYVKTGRLIMFVLKEKQDYIDNYVTQNYKGIEADKLYYAGHHPACAVGDLEGVQYSVSIKGSIQFNTTEDAQLIIDQHGMSAIFEVVASDL